MKPCLAPYRNRAGFTLIELLAVLIIIAILMVIFVPKLLGARKVAEEQSTRATIKQIETAIAEYEQHFGDYPPSQVLEKWGTAPNDTNLGAEALFLSLWSNDWESPGLNEDHLINSDDDATTKPYSRLSSPKLFELRDDFVKGNPIAYFHRRDYGVQQKYMTVDAETGELTENVVTARKNPATGSWYNPTKFQLISAGLDGVFGTEDDIGNWQKPKE